MRLPQCELVKRHIRLSIEPVCIWLTCDWLTAGKLSITKAGAMDGFGEIGAVQSCFTWRSKLDSVYLSRRWQPFKLEEV